MNIVFLLRLWPIYGGGETVTICLANEMAKRGHAVTVFYFKDSETNELPYIDPSIKAVRIPDVRCDEYTYDSDDGIKITIALKLYQQNSFDFIINQWWPVVFLSPLRSFFNAKIISVHHTALSDKVLFLSPQFKDQYIQLRNPKSVEKLDWCYNPLVFDNFISMDEICKKRKEVLFVGRLLESNKKISKLLTIWKHIQLDKEFNEWHLYIVGDGKDKSFYLDFTRNNNIPNVHFEGRRYPIPYYKRASIFAMTSAFEGFPMSIIEAQQNGVVPIVMDSFLSVHDIIDNDVNGVLISYGNTTMFAESLKALMKDEMQRNKLAIKGLETCRRFNIETVVDRWEEIFEKMR